MADRVALSRTQLKRNNLTVSQLHSILDDHKISYPRSSKKADLVMILKENLPQQVDTVLNTQPVVGNTIGLINTVSRGPVNKVKQKTETKLIPVGTPGRGDIRRSARLGCKGSGENRTVEEWERRHTRQNTNNNPSILVEELTSSTSRKGREMSLSDLYKKFESRKLTAPDSNIHRGAGKSKKSYYGIHHENSMTVKPPRSITNAQPPLQKPKSGCHRKSREEYIKPTVAPSFATVVSKRKAEEKKTSRVGKTTICTVFLAIFSLAITTWRQEKLQVGYCGIGETSTFLEDVELPLWASFFKPECELCPENANCYSDMRTVCKDDFVLTPNTFSLGGLIPLAPTCNSHRETIEDGAIAI